MGDPAHVPALGDFLGEFTYELKTPGDYIVEFCAGGPRIMGIGWSKANKNARCEGFP